MPQTYKAELLSRKPGARIFANGKGVPKRLLSTSSGGGILVSLTVTDQAGTKADTLELVLDNRENYPVPPVGSLIEVWVGYEPEPAALGRFRLDSWTLSGAPNLLTLSGTSAELTTAIKGQKLRSWHDTTVGDIVRKIAGEHGLGVTVDSALSARAVEHIDQQTESDLNFLSRLAVHHGAVFKLADGKVVFVPRGVKGGTNSKTAQTVKPGDVSSWTITESERGGHKSVVAHWHDHKAGKRHSVTAGDGKPAHRLKTVFKTEAEAHEATVAALRDLQRGKREASLEMPGMPGLLAGDEIELAGFHLAVDGTYGATVVTHTLDSGGYRTSITLEVGGASFQ